MKLENKPHQSPSATQSCVPIPDFERINFYYGQALGVAEFQAEQSYFMEKLRLYNRCFHGYGIVCGLDVKPIPETDECLDTDRVKSLEVLERIASIDSAIAELQDAAEKNPEDESIGPQLKKLIAEQESLKRRLDETLDCFAAGKPIPAEVCIDCGWAVDCNGRDIVVRQAQRVDLWSLLTAEQVLEVKQMASKHELIVELSVCYCEQRTFPSRPLFSDACVPVSKCVYGRTREGFKFRISLNPSNPDQRCSNCCEACEQECVVLAHIRWNPKRSITEEHIDMSPRRNLSLYQPTVITGISWRHAATYKPGQAKTVLGTGHKTDGLEIQFSKPVSAETIYPGVVELYCFKGGRGVSGSISHIEGSFVDKPDSGWITSVKYRDDTNETLNPGDRVLIVIRTNFILDACCQPVDGEHVGGLVPQIEAYITDAQDEQSVPPPPRCAQSRRLPWTSGNGRPGATFESWFYISEEKA
ncbi:MAG: hypothetical protein R3C53_06860 [Pirellulaceae bacterium]